MMMMKCWEMVPENRPTFKELHINTSKYIERIAGYLELGFNPFLGEGFSVAKVSVDRMQKEEVEQQMECAVVTSTSVETSVEHNMLNHTRGTNEGINEEQ